jgi:two-component system, OmpR family, response regulator ChvI
LINQSNSSNLYRNSNRILLVDDEPDITFSFNMILEDHGFAVDSYNDPIYALSSFKSGIYAIAILDIRMPGMNGFELSLELRKVDNKIKILFMTAYDIHDEGINQSKLKVLKEKPVILKKPISLNDLVSKIKKEMI